MSSDREVETTTITTYVPIRTTASETPKSRRKRLEYGGEKNNVNSPVLADSAGAYEYPHTEIVIYGGLELFNAHAVHSIN